MSNNEINEETRNQMNNTGIKGEVIKNLDSMNVEAIEEQVELNKLEEAIEAVNKEPISLNKFETNRIFNEGMDAFLKNKKNLFDCPYDKDTNTNRNMAWLEGFKYGAEYFINDFANSYMKEMIDKIKIDVYDSLNPMITVTDKAEVGIEEILDKK